jgi:hypothetical protein
VSKLYYRIGQAAARLGTSKYHLRRLAEEGLLLHRTSKTGQLLISDSEIDRLEEEGVPPVPASAEPEDALEAVGEEADAAPPPSQRDELLATPSRTVISSAEKVLATRHKLETMRIEEDIEHIKDSRRERREQKAVLKSAQEAAQHRLEENQRALQARIEEQRQRRMWLDSWVQTAIHALPYGVPESHHLDVRRNVERALQDVHPFQSYSLVSTLVRAASAKVLEPYLRQQETEKAVEESLATLDSSAKNVFGKPTEWQIRAEHEVRIALRALPQGATFQEKQGTAKTAVHKINAEFEHTRVCNRIVGQVTLWGGTDEERRRAKLAAEKALKALPIGSSAAEMEEVKNRALKPFEEAVENQRREEEKQQRMEERIAESPNCIRIYLEELDSEDELESDGACDVTTLAYELRDAIVLKLRRELERRELTDAQFKRLIEKLVDEEL